VTNSKTTLFGHIPIFKKLAHPLFGAGSHLLVHILFTPSEGLESFEIAFSRCHGSVTMEKRPPGMGQLHGP
jgi:hypothetical protein